MILSVVNVVSGNAAIGILCLSRFDDKGEVDPPLLGEEEHGLLPFPLNEGSTFSNYNISCEILVNF